jgi:hypothetical protein
MHECSCENSSIRTPRLCLSIAVTLQEEDVQWDIATAGACAVPTARFDMPTAQHHRSKSSTEYPVSLEPKAKYVIHDRFVSGANNIDE